MENPKDAENVQPANLGVESAKDVLETRRQKLDAPEDSIVSETPT